MRVIDTRLTRQFGLSLPILSAPMAHAAGGKLAAAVTRAGGLGLIGGGYLDAAGIDAEFDAAGNAPVGCGVITWVAAEYPDRLEAILARLPRAVLVSFGDPAPLMPALRDADVPVIAQVQTLKDARHAAGLGVRAIVAQGAEAGGHGQSRATMTLVPEVANFLSAANPEVLLLAAGGIADGRGLAAALMLGADGVLVGSRLWASTEAQVHPAMWQAAQDATGDETIRSSVMDIARGLNWPARYSCRVLRNGFTERWQDDLDGLRAAAPGEAARWAKAWEAGDPRVANTFVGEATGLIDTVRPAEEILRDMAQEAAALLAGGWRR
ncbi:MAG: nitronate monooxygenase [Pseudomonadota bacterium]